MITLNKRGRKRMYLNVVRAVCDKPIAYIILNTGMLKAVPPRSGTLAKDTYSQHFIQHSTGNPSQRS